MLIVIVLTLISIPIHFAVKFHAKIVSPNKITNRMNKFNLRTPKSNKMNPTPSSSTASPPWIELPSDVTANILQRLGAIEILESAQKVCTTWRSVCNEPAMWRVIDMENLGDLQSTRYKLDIMCRHAVDRSQGQLIDIHIEYFGNDDLVRYIAERSSQLRRLRITGCYHISGKALCEAVSKFPNIEELHLFFMSSILAEDIRSIGRSCPNLKSFTLNNTWRWYPHIEDNEYARAVADTMNGLRYLKLSGNEMTNDGVQALLEGCPCLESLDIRKCFNVVMEGDLAKRCAEQIQNLIQPFDSPDDHESDSETYEAEPFYDSQMSDDYRASSYENYSHLFGRDYISDDEALYYVPA